MLTHPFVNIPYVPVPLYLLGGISIYDREETLGEELWVYNPNEKNDREKIIKVFILPDFDYLTYRHRFVTFKMLEDILRQENFDFAAQFESDYDEPRTIAWNETEIDDPRGFFEDIYRLASEAWKDDLHKASLEDQSTW
ncbi:MULTISPECIES: hypothetical protein [unclassified Pseudomonas]|uniref:hypothetical protein n=1 Tax=unclassified Pseudomonas TaxID=196821 RepID=UPI000CD0386C|nr:MULTISPECIES: hypothetical protein [unclassified Pseudomonas]POA31203.1 hypothetical protein C1887_14180 [Pseudomonas sp. GW456-R21]POA67510.1 hypothetical protein C1884_12855 [Pseudomonas sp. GW460-R15]TVT81545.1 hypothetical protein FPT12_18995 [Pseudomonas sp. H3(2019)]